MPLTDLGSGTYLGSQGGLYPGGSSTRPPSHDAAGLAAAAQVQPVNATGAPDPTNGRIVLASMGMSNTTQEFQSFLPLAAADASLSSRMLFVDGAQGGQTAQNWADPNHACWTTFASRLATAGAADAQLQVVWCKLASPAGTLPSTFPAGAQQLQTWIRDAILTLKSKYPSVKIVYLSSRIYAGYATTALNPEPYAYESGFAVKWVVEDWINGVLPASPWVAWGPYLWADGLGADNVVGGVAGRSDGLEWLCTDFSPDGTHPGTPGRQKVAQMLLDWLKADATSQSWMVSSAPAPPGGGGGGGSCGLVGLEALLLIWILTRRRAAARA